MINFTIGPVQSSEKILEIGKEQIPYFRTKEFSFIVNDSERLILKLLNASKDDRAIFLTGSGTSAMESSVINTLSNNDNALIINGGSFGQRFVDICKIHNIKFTEIKLEFGKTLKKEDLYKYDGKEYTCLLVNSCETSSGTKYDMDMIASYCKENNLFLIVDAIGSAFADEFDMNKYNADIVILSSHKALACAPGISIVLLSSRAINRINSNNVQSMYFDYKSYLENSKRGQTPFTPAVGIIRQLHQRLLDIEKDGYMSEVNKVKKLAEDFRKKIKDLPFEILSDNPSNTLTALYTKNASAKQIFNHLQDKYDIWICPNGNEYAETVFRVGHIGNLSNKDNDVLINAFNEMMKEGLL